jgi:hypothetical protein
VLSHSSFPMWCWFYDAVFPLFQHIYTYIVICKHKTTRYIYMFICPYMYLCVAIQILRYICFIFSSTLLIGTVWKLRMAIGLALFSKSLGYFLLKQNGLFPLLWLVFWYICYFLLLFLFKLISYPLAYLFFEYVTALHVSTLWFFEINMMGSFF